jgi:hypothetical protein
MSKKFDALEARKELLMMKAELERMEFGGQVDALRKEYAWVNVFKQFANLLGRFNSRALGPVVGFAGPVWQERLRKHPILGMLASTALLRFGKPLSRLAMRASVGAVVLAAGVLWFQTRSPWASRSAIRHTAD